MSKRSHGKIRFDKMRDHEIRNAMGRQFKSSERSMNVGLDTLAREMGVKFKGEVVR